jgi:hypothetical protein
MELFRINYTRIVNDSMIRNKKVKSTQYQYKVIIKSTKTSIIDSLILRKRNRLAGRDGCRSRILGLLNNCKPAHPSKFDIGLNDSFIAIFCSCDCIKKAVFYSFDSARSPFLVPFSHLFLSPLYVGFPFGL